MHKYIYTYIYTHKYIFYYILYYCYYEIDENFYPLKMKHETKTNIFYNSIIHTDITCHHFLVCHKELH